METHGLNFGSWNAAPPSFLCSFIRAFLQSTPHTHTFIFLWQKNHALLCARDVGGHWSYSSTDRTTITLVPVFQSWFSFAFNFSIFVMGVGEERIAALFLVGVNNQRLRCDAKYHCVFCPMISARASCYSVLMIYCYRAITMQAAANS